MINRDCNTCSQIRCIPRKGGSSPTAPHRGSNPGATAGAIFATLIFIALAVGIFFWYRRKTRLRGEPISEIPKDVPASAETVLQRPDPTEKRTSSQTETSTARALSNPSSPTIEIEFQSQCSSPHFPSPPALMNLNPFDDTTSIQTAGTEGTNVIPIALVPSESNSEQLTSPIRPARSPDLHLNLEEVSVPPDVVRRPSVSDRSLKSNRNSYMSNASYSSDFLNEAPMIITPSKAAVRQVLGVVKAEVINAPGSMSSGSHLKPPSASRPAVGSPLAASSFGPSDMVKEVNEAVDPFSDDASVNAELYSPSDGISAESCPGVQFDSAADVSSPTQFGSEGRPLSISTQAGSIIDIGSATRVKVGSSNAISMPYRTTVARLISPGTGNLVEQQQRAHTHAQVQAQGSDIGRRVSTSSALSAASTRADSILESFPFVPPSPISNRPVRSPPVSPLGKQSFNNDSVPQSSSPNHVIKVLPPSPQVQETSDQTGSNHDTVLPPPPDRRVLGLSTGSQLSTASSGLESFPFQIDSGDGNATLPSFSMLGRQRASLDTLALTSDLSSYPLGFDRDSVQSKG